MDYDLDTSGGLMEEIRKLVAPPQSENDSKRKRNSVKEHRRHHHHQGRTVNHDCCDSCKEGGDLLCCDRCPAAFHLNCHDPPLDEEDLPDGEWICHRCRVGPSPIPPIPDPNMDDDTASTGSSQSRSTKTRYGRQVSFIVDEDSMSVHSDLSDTPLTTLIKAAKHLNPKTFELPKEMTPSINLPGSSKRHWVKEGNKWQWQPPIKKLAHELDNGMVPLPAKTCFICTRSCRVAPLSQCDYCPLLFHTDCLNPPLTTLPTGRWMCPNHAENFVDEKLLKSVGVAERVKLWESCGSLSDQHTVKINFLNKVHRLHPPFRIKVKHPRRKTISVPQSIKSQYEFPPLMLPKLKDLTDMNEINKHQTPIEPVKPHQSSLDDQEEWLSGVVALQTSISKYFAKNQISLNKTMEVDTEVTDVSATLTPTASKPTASVVPTVKSERSRTPSPALSNSSLCSNESSISKDRTTYINNNEPLHSTVLVHKEMKKPNGPVSLLSCNTLCNSISNKSLESGDILKTGDINNVIKASGQDSVVKSTSVNSGHNKSLLVTKSNAGLVTKLIPNSTANKNASFLSPRTTNTSPLNISMASASSTIGSTKGKTSVASSVLSSMTSPAVLTLNNTLQASIDSQAEMELNSLDKKLVQILAWQRLQQLLPPKANRKGMLSGLLSQTGCTEVQARAVLCPIAGKGQPIQMSYRSLSLGSSVESDACLTSFGHCNFISAKHACIFYDETTHHFELLNYSEHGTTVDNVLYSCDFSPKAVDAPKPTKLVKAVRNIIKGKKEVKKDVEKDKRFTMSAHAFEAGKKACSCRSSGSSLIGGAGAGWEGTAILHHGSYIKFGCLQFVFSITDQQIVPETRITDLNVHAISRRHSTSLIKPQYRSELT